MLNSERPSLPTIITELVLLCDVALGMSWLISAPSRSDVPALHTARTLIDFLPGESMRWYGGLLVLLSAAALLSMMRRDDRNARSCFTALVPFWTFFTIIYATAAVTVHNASLSAPWWAAIVLIGHIRPLLTVDLTRRR